jgi:hypothetical protein
MGNVLVHGQKKNWGCMHFLSSFAHAAVLHKRPGTVRCREQGLRIAARSSFRKAMVITSDNNRGTMSLRCAVVVTVLLITGVSIAGCTGSPPIPVATPAPVTVATTVITIPASAGTTALGTPTTPWPTPETPKTGTPYSKTYTFTATGDYDEHTFTTDDDRTWVFRMTYPWEGDFIVVLQDKWRTDFEVLADTRTPSATRTKSVFLKAGTYYLDAKADTPWTITMSTE